MKKQVFFGIIGGLVVLEIAFVIFSLLPNMSACSNLTEEVQNEINALSFYTDDKYKCSNCDWEGFAREVRIEGKCPACGSELILVSSKCSPQKFPTEEAVKSHQDNAKALKEGYISCLKYFSECDENLERYFTGLGSAPALNAFVPKYIDEMNNLRRLCEEKGIVLATKETRLTEQMRRILSEEVERTRGMTVPDYLTSPKEEYGLWEAAQITPANMRTAQKEFWVQEAIVKALIEANATQLTLLYFPYSQEKEKEKEKKKKTELERLFKTSDVLVIAEMPYKRVTRFVNAVLDVNRHKLIFLLLKLRVELKELQELTVPDFLARKNMKPEVAQLLSDRKIVFDANDLKGVLPEVILKQDTPLDFGRVTLADVKQGNRLPITQDDLMTEPPVIVVLRLRLYDFSPDEAAQKLLSSQAK